MQKFFFLIFKPKPTTFHYCLDQKPKMTWQSKEKGGSKRNNKKNNRELLKEDDYDVTESQAGHWLIKGIKSGNDCYYCKLVVTSKKLRSICIVP